MIERFSVPAREVVSASGRHAKRLGDSTTGTQHLLLGLLEQEDRLAARVLAEFAVSPALVRESLLRLTVVSVGEDSPSKAAQTASHRRSTRTELQRSD